MEILNLGFADKNQEGTVCGDPTPNAVIRLQRYRDNGGSTCADYSRATDPHDYWPNQLYDTREGNYRDVATTGSGSGMRVGGVMGYVTLDIANLAQMVCGRHSRAGATGTSRVEQQRVHRVLLRPSRRPQRRRRDRACRDGRIRIRGFHQPGELRWRAEQRARRRHDGRRERQRAEPPDQHHSRDLRRRSGQLRWLQRVLRDLADALRRQHPAVVLLHVDQCRKPWHRAHQSAGPLPAGAQARRRRHRERCEPAAADGVDRGRREPGVRAGQLQRDVGSPHRTGSDTSPTCRRRFWPTR